MRSVYRAMRARRIQQPKHPAVRFQPLALFKNSEPGVWYDPSDLSTLYQDAAGTTPVTAVEQPVGLILDKSKGLVLGPELVANGDFSDGTMGWTAGVGSISVVSGEMRVVRPRNTSSAYQAISTVVGRTYKVTGLQRVVTPTSQPNLVARTGTDPSSGVIGFGNPTTSTVLEANTFYFTAVGTTTYLHLTAGAAAGEVAFDNISVRELPGNHAYQTTATSRPVLSARVNLLTNTVFSGAVTGTPGVAPTGWSFNSTGGTLVSANDGVIVFSATNARQILGVAMTIPANTTQTWSVRIEENPNHLPFAELFFAVNATGAVAQYRANGVVVLFTYVPAAGDTLTITLINGATQITPVFRIGVGTANAVTGTAAFSRPDVRVANDGVNLPPYQRVNTATNYDTVGFPHYLRFDGVDDFLVTPTITPGIDKVQVFAGVRKLSDATVQVLYEMSTSTNDNNGCFNAAPGYSGSGSGTGPYWQAVSKGTSFAVTATSPTFPAPATAVQTQLVDISGDSAILRIDGTQAAQSTADQGTVNFLAYPLYIGRRGGTSLPFNGHLYSLIVRFGSNLPAATIENTEKYINTKTRAF